ncbi:hypothetical protein GCM10027414_24210 [Humibacter ginsengiterrae]
MTVEYLKHNGDLYGEYYSIPVHGDTVKAGIRQVQTAFPNTPENWN